MANKKPDVYEDSKGRTRLVWSQDDDIKARFDGFLPKKKSETSSTTVSKPKSDS